MRLPVERVVDLLMVSHAPSVIARYRARMVEGDRFPPIGVVRLAGRYVVTDGHKRFEACRPIGGPTVVVDVWPLRRLLLDQWRQVVGNLRKMRRIAIHSVTDPAEAWRLLTMNFKHWERVAVSLVTRWRERRQRREDRSR